MGIVVGGMDGCRGGWVLVRLELDTRNWTAHSCTSVREGIEQHPEIGWFGIDTPIGLLTGEPRRCDQEARRLLSPRGSCVFNAPDQAVLYIPDEVFTFAEANRVSRSKSGKGMSLQSFAIAPKIKEVDQLVFGPNPPLAEAIEVHPELSFLELNDGVPLTTKHRSAGYRQRAELLADKLRLEIPERRQMRRSYPWAKADDILDAIIAAWSMHRYANGRHKQVPISSQVTATGREIRIVY